MPTYQKLQKFMQLVNAANPKFEKWKNSSLRPLINVLNDIKGTFTQAQQALAALPAAKATKCSLLFGGDLSGAGTVCGQHHFRESGRAERGTVHTDGLAEQIRSRLLGREPRHADVQLP